MLYVSTHPGTTVTCGDAFAITSPEHLAKYKRPVEITILDDLPKNAVGKIEKPDSASATGRLARNHIDQQELIMSFTKPEFPAGRSGHLLGQAADGTDALLTQHWERQRLRVSAHGARDLHREARALLRARRRRGRHGDVGSAGVLACRRSGGTSRSSTRRRSCGRCCSRRSASPGHGVRWPARSSR